MLSSFPVSVLIAAVLGFLSGLGTGGGSLLILWLTLVGQMDESTARTINLMFFIPSALIAVLFHQRQGRLRFRVILPAIIAGCFAAWICVLFRQTWDTNILRKLFGLILVFTGIRELTYKNKECR